MKESLKRADDLYRQGKYQEAYDLAVPCDQKLDPEGCAEACRIRAWAKYYIAIKGNPEEKIRNAGHAAGYASVVSISIDPKRRLSAYNVLPLALWISGNQSGAWEASDEALQEFPEEPSAWNTRGILARWAKDYEQGVIIGDRVTDRSVARGDFLTAGHGQQNKGDALRALGRIGEAHTAYEEALKRYRQHEHSSGKSATPHIVNAEKKTCRS